MNGTVFLSIRNLYMSVKSKVSIFFSSFKSRILFKEIFYDRNDTALNSEHFII